VEVEGKVLVLRRVHGFFADSCPLYRSLKPAIAITTELVLTGGDGNERGLETVT